MVRGFKKLMTRSESGLNDAILLLGQNSGLILINWQINKILANSTLAPSIRIL